MKTITLQCSYCYRDFEKRLSSYKYEVDKRGRTKFFCSTVHAYEYKKKPLINGFCIGCGKYFERVSSGNKDLGKFCTKGCSASYISKSTAWKRRGQQNHCVECGAECRRAKKCSDCKSKVNALSKVSLGELRAKYNTSQYHAKIRGNARHACKKASMKMECVVCKYSLHVDIAHIKAVKDFPDIAIIGEVNALENLTVLCPNHHWEFDNGFLTL